MKKVWKSLQDKSGYIGIEYIILAGLIMALGAWAWIKFYALGEELVDGAGEKTRTVLEITVNEG